MSKMEITDTTVLKPETVQLVPLGPFIISALVVVDFFTLTDRASTIPSNTRSCQSGTWSAGQKKIRGTSTKLQTEDSLICFVFVWCPCMAINVVNVQHNGGFLPDIVLAFSQLQGVEWG